MKLKKIHVVISTIILLFLNSCTSWSVTYTGDYCEDGIQDRTETDLDCGGLYCDPCEEGYACEDNSDCSSEYCENSVCETEEYDASTADSDGDGVVDASDICEGDDDTIDVDEDDIADCVDDSVSNNSYVGGSTGIMAEFVDFNLNEEGYNDVVEDEVFPVHFILENTGEYTVTTEQINMEIRGISESDFSGLDFEKTNSEELTSISAEASNFDSEEVDFGDAIYEGLTGTFYDARIYLEYDYPYQTQIIIPKVCLKYDLRSESGCEVSEAKTAYVSGAPIQIGTITEEPYGTGSVYLEIPIYNAGGSSNLGYYVGRAKAYESDAFSALHDTVIFSVEGEEIGWSCYYLEGSDSPIIYIGREEGDQATLTCISDTFEEGTERTEELKITLDYYYQETVSAEVRISAATS